MTIHGDFIMLEDDNTPDTPKRRFKVPKGVRVQLSCPRCYKPMERHNGCGRRPRCCDDCRTPAEKKRRDNSRKHNEKVRQAKHAAKKAAAT